MQINYSKDLNYNPLNDKTISITDVHYLDHGLNNKPINDRTGLDHSSIELVHHSDPHCKYIEMQCYDLTMQEIIS